MKNLMIKAVLPCLALLMLLSAKPIEKDPSLPVLEEFTVESVKNLPTNFTVLGGDGGNCLNPGPRTITILWSGGTLNNIRLDPVSSFTVTSTNPQTIVTCCSASWTINVAASGHLIFNIYGRETGSGSYSYLTTRCFKNCAEPGDCE